MKRLGCYFAIFSFLDQSNIPNIFINKEIKLNIWILNYMILILNYVILIFMILILNYVIFIFMNGTLQCLNISLATWLQSQMTREM